MTVSGCEGNIQQTPKIWFWQEKEDFLYTWRQMKSVYIINTPQL